MPSEATIATLDFLTGQINIYFGLFVFIIGIFGQICNVLVFTSLKTFRETTCAFYLIIVSLANLGQTFPVLIRVLTGLNVNLSTTGIFCKFRWSCAQYLSLVSFASMCLATIDQFLSMTSYRHLNTIQLARRQITSICIVCFIHSVLTFLFYDSNQYTCIITNASFAKYFNYFFLLILFGVLPLTLMSIFALLAYFRIRTIASRQINHVRLSRDRQLTAMTLSHVLCAIITTVPFVVSNAYILSLKTTDLEELARNRLVSAITILFCFSGFACTFYIYCCVSRRFRQQTVHVLVGIHWNRWQRRMRNTRNNQVLPVHDQPRANVPSSYELALY